MSIPRVKKTRKAHCDNISGSGSPNHVAKPPGDTGPPGATVSIHDPMNTPPPTSTQSQTRNSFNPTFEVQGDLSHRPMQSYGSSPATGPPPPRQYTAHMV